MQHVVEVFHLLLLGRHTLVVMKDVFRLSYCNSGAYSGEVEKREKGTKTGSEKKGETGESVTAATAWVLFLDLMVLPLSPPPL